MAIAHRGGSLLRPENTMLAFEHALALGADALECDVRLARDGEPVVVHDDTLDRTTDARGPVSAMSADELERVDAGWRFATAGTTPFRGATGVPRLATLLARATAVPVIVEIKGDDPRAVEPVIDVVTAAGAADRVVLAGFSHRVLDAVRRRAPGIPTSASMQEVQAAIRRSYFLLPPRTSGYRLFQVPVRFRGRQVLRRSFVRTFLRAGLPVQAWIVDDPDEMRRLIAWGVSGLISDRPDQAVAIVRDERA
ncbi:MAG: glycerophosphodiester phosphodiesterase [Acidobacteria bacterium]|nr:glycerophosphodiester phosphodiesterase [Acidobacteriota bacterium]